MSATDRLKSARPIIAVVAMLLFASSAVAAVPSAELASALRRICSDTSTTKKVANCLNVALSTSKVKQIYSMKEPAVGVPENEDHIIESVLREARVFAYVPSCADDKKRFAKIIEHLKMYGISIKYLLEDCKSVAGLIEEMTGAKRKYAMCPALPTYDAQAYRTCIGAIVSRDIPKVQEEAVRRRQVAFDQLPAERRNTELNIPGPYAEDPLNRLHYNLKPCTAPPFIAQQDEMARVFGVLATMQLKERTYDQETRTAQEFSKSVPCYDSLTLAFDLGLLNKNSESQLFSDMQTIQSAQCDGEKRASAPPTETEAAFVAVKPFVEYYCDIQRIGFQSQDEPSDNRKSVIGGMFLVKETNSCKASSGPIDMYRFAFFFRNAACKLTDAGKAICRGEIVEQCESLSTPGGRADQVLREEAVLCAPFRLTVQADISYQYDKQACSWRPTNVKHVPWSVRPYVQR